MEVVFYVFLDFVRVLGFVMGVDRMQYFWYNVRVYE